VAIIALERTMFMTSFGSRKARPHFKIVGYKLRSQIGTQNLLTDETNKIDRPPPTLAEELNDDLPGDLAAPSPENKPTKAPAPTARPTDRRELKKPRAKTAARSPSRQRLNNMDAG
jgi:hypothetical protein